MANKDKTLQIPATMTGASTLSDGGMSLRFHTQELQDEEAVEVMKHRNEFGYLLFSPNEFQDKDIPKGEAEYEGKTPSQRLRAVLFVYWQQIGAKGDFENFYRTRMDKIVEQVKAKLD